MDIAIDRNSWRQYYRWAIPGILLSLAITGPIQAADGAGQFALRGTGLLPCSVFTQERARRSELYRLAASWADGYLTGVNQHQDTTYDAASFESTELLMAVVAEHCQDNPSDPLFGVLNSLFKKLAIDRLQERSPKLEITNGQLTASIYVSVLTRAQDLLASYGHYSGDATGKYDVATIAAFKAYQSSIGFEPTGFPDQATLWRLFRGANLLGR